MTTETIQVPTLKDDAPRLARRRLNLIIEAIEDAELHDKLATQPGRDAAFESQIAEGRREFARENIESLIENKWTV